MSDFEITGHLPAEPTPAPLIPPKVGVYLAACVLLTGCGGSESPDHQTSSSNVPPTVSSETSDPHQYFLPPIPETGWNDSENLGGGVVIQGTPAAVVDVDPATGTFAFRNDRLPAAYETAFTAALGSPVVEIALQSGNIEAVTVRPPLARDNENAYFKPKEKEIEFVVKAGEHEQRMLFDTRALLSITVHEATHALSEDWYKHIRPGDPSRAQVPSTEIAQPLARVVTACRSMRDAVFTSFISEERAELAAAFQATADQFQAAIQSGVISGYPIKDAEQTARLNGYQSAFAETATALTNNDPRLYEVLSRNESTCTFVDPFWLPVPFAEIELGAYDEYTESKPLFAVYSAATKDANEAYGCIKDGNAMAELTGAPKALGGHAYDNPTEAASSVVAMLAMNPGYITECMTNMEQTDPELANAAWELMSAVWGVTIAAHPEVREALVTDSDAAAVIDTLESIKPN